MPENYRPISLLSCIGKLFTIILNKRSTQYLESDNLWNSNQAGFSSTVDNIFILHLLTDYVKHNKTKLFYDF
jgi:hypothetical protein